MESLNRCCGVMSPPDIDYEIGFSEVLCAKRAPQINISIQNIPVTMLGFCRGNHFRCPT